MIHFLEGLTYLVFGNLAFAAAYIGIGMAWEYAKKGGKL